MNQDSRSRLLVKNVFASFVFKGWSAVVVLLMVPLTLKMLGIYHNGIWLTISGILLWIDMFDIGLGNGLRNEVARSIAAGDTPRVRQAVSSTLFMLTIVVLPLFLLLFTVICFFDMNAALGDTSLRVSNMDTILVVAVAMSCATFVLKSVGNFYMGMQLPAVNNLVTSLGYTVAFLLTYAAYLYGYRSLLVVAVINTVSPLLIWLACMLYTFLYKYPQYRPSARNVNLRMSRSLCSTGVLFFILQVCSVILFTSTNIIISQAFSPAEVTPYQIAYRYFSLMLVAFNIICLPFWNATTDAYARKDMKWIVFTGRRLNRLLMLIFAGLLLMVLLSDHVYRLWVGAEVQIPIGLSASMALYIFILIVSMRYSYILNGINVLRIQLVFTVSAVVVFIPLAWVVCRYYGTVTSLVLTMCLINLPGLIANRWKYNQLFHTRP